MLGKMGLLTVEKGVSNLSVSNGGACGRLVQTSGFYAPGLGHWLAKLWAQSSPPQVSRASCKYSLM